MSTAIISSPVFLKHTRPDHPENAARLTAIHAALDRSGLRERLNDLAPQPATREQITAVHTADYMDKLESMMKSAPTYVDMAPTYIVPESFSVAVLAAGGAIRAVDAVLDGEAQSVFALLRPPGHHATPFQPMGFCLFNNIAIAASHARTRGLQRVMIVDFDVHHGNGTQNAFYADPSVFFLSTHEWGIYPGTGAMDEIGEGPGRGYNLNVPLPEGAGDSAFERIAEEIIAPAAQRFKPELLLVSAGFDAHWADPLANLQLSVIGYARLMRVLLAIADRYCGGKIALMLEGGYDLEVLGGSVPAVIRVLLGDSETHDPIGLAPQSEPDIQSLCRRIRELHHL